MHFPVSCAPAVQKTFERGAALLHSFWYDEAEKTFSEVTRADPGCGMGYWGVAMSLYHPIWVPPTPADLKRAGRVEKAKAAGAKTQRERDYIAAIEVFYRDSDKVAHQERALAWRNAMQQLSERYPEDREASIFFALALIGTAPPTDKTYATQKQAAAILNKILPEQPNHPGIAHYLIHSYDTLHLASLALPAARSYAKIAPTSPHALHMPSHIFTRLGLWQDSIQSNLASAAAAKTIWPGFVPAPRRRTSSRHGVLVYAYLQSCQDGKAKRVVEEAAAVTKVDAEVFQAGYALRIRRATRSKGAVGQRRRLSRSAQPPPLGPFSLRQGHYIRARHGISPQRRYGLRSKGDREAGFHSKGAGAGPRGIQLGSAGRGTAPGRVCLCGAREGNNEKALQLLRTAAELEDKTEKHPVTPGAVLPARECWEILIELDQPAQALPNFRPRCAIRRAVQCNLRGWARGRAVGQSKKGERALFRADRALRECRFPQDWSCKTPRHFCSVETAATK